jgi:hypothetical protein
MQDYRVFEESIMYKAGKHNCELSFFRCNEPVKHYPVYDLELTVNKTDYLYLSEESLAQLEDCSPLLGMRSIISATIKVLDDWCARHPYTFVSFFDCLSNFYHLYLKAGFICDGRGETFVAYLNEQGKRTTFKGMLNLLADDDFWVNDLWRVAKDSDYYTGEIYTPVDALKALLG